MMDYPPFIVYEISSFFSSRTQLIRQMTHPCNLSDNFSVGSEKLSFHEQDISIRVVHADYYLAKPVADFNDACFSGFRSSAVSYVPVIRIFGPSSNGAKICVHVHGILPYLFIRNWSEETSFQHLYSLAINLDNAINQSYACSSNKTPHIHRVVEVVGKPLYGYHSDQKKFLKIEFYNPRILKRAAELLSNGKIMSTVFDPYEAHIPYLMQFFIDYNIHGMNHIKFSSYYCRSENTTLSQFRKQTFCQLEVDSSVSLIIENLNRCEDIGELINPGLVFIIEEEKNRKRLKGEPSQLCSKIVDKRLLHVPTRSELHYKTILSQKIKSIMLQEKSVGHEESIDADSSCNELDEYDSNLLHVLENLQQINKKFCGNESYSSQALFDNEHEAKNEEQCFSLSDACSQPLLKIIGEDDSILGENFSDDDLDEQDHLVLSDSIMLPQKNASGSESDNDYKIHKISQLDGINDHCSTKKCEIKDIYAVQNPKIQNGFVTNSSRFHGQSVEIAPLTSNNTLPNFSGLTSTSTSTNQEPQTNCSKTTYPQLNINVRRSPKTNKANTRSQPLQKVISQSGTNLEDEFSAENVWKQDRLVFSDSVTLSDMTTSRSIIEPSTTLHASCIKSAELSTNFTPPKPGTSESSNFSPNQLELQKNGSKVTYPPLDINVKKSPRTDISACEVTDRRALRNTKRRRIDFGLSSNPGMELMSVRWKRHRSNTNLENQDCTSVKNLSSENELDSGICMLKNSDHEELPVLTAKKSILDIPSKVKCSKSINADELILNIREEAKNTYDSHSSLASHQILLGVSPSNHSKLESHELMHPSGKNLSTDNSFLPHEDIQNDEYLKKSFDVERNTNPIIDELFVKSDSEIMETNEMESFHLNISQDKTENDCSPGGNVPEKPCLSSSIYNDEILLNSNISHSTPCNIDRETLSSSPSCTPIVPNSELKIKQPQDVKGRQLSKEFPAQPILSEIAEDDESETAERIFQNSSCVAPSGVECKESNVDTTSASSHPLSNACSERIDLTITNSFGFQMGDENLQTAKTSVEHYNVTIMCMELFAITRQNLNPDPEFDSVQAIFYTIFHDSPLTPNLQTSMIVMQNDSYSLDHSIFNCDKLFVCDEKKLLDEFINAMKKWDPDILIGYEVEMSSWGYLIQRGQFLGRRYDQELSRIQEWKTAAKLNDQSAFDDSEFAESINIAGRIVLNVWRLMRHEISLQSYTFENIFFHVMHQRVPKYSFKSLTDLWNSSLQRWIAIDYYLLRVEGSILILQQLDFINRTSELAKLFGIQFYEVLSRGSQFRVESMMLRLAKRKNYIAVSPTTKQRASMKAPECLPLIMEPESMFYTDPVIVLDFQSLYPSIIIAYNYCFSTCVGRLEHLLTCETFKLGCIQHSVPPELVLKLEPFLNISPCGVAFVNKEICPGILPLMLKEIIDTRILVKNAMKENKNDKALQRALHARQLGLKLIANVTYGYTSANFSGRMPCIEVGDSIVSKGRETLEGVIELVTKEKKWDAKVIYGDTDSVFILVPNRTKEEAFSIGAEIADAVTNINPDPIKLKFEKIYYPCILQTKKRYVGYMYESLSQTEPIYDAKGIETVRRDGCPATSKILEKSLKLLFDGHNNNSIKLYVQRQFSKLISGRLNVHELTFAREYRGMRHYKPAACVPALQLARQAILRDRRSEPRVKERVRYVLVAGGPGVPLIKLVRTPEDFLNSPGSRINAEYYITRAILPALNRCFSLMGTDVFTWYSEMSKKVNHLLSVDNILKNKSCKKNIISHYFSSSKCVTCNKVAAEGICSECQSDPQQLCLILGSMVNKFQCKFNYVKKLCLTCSNNSKVQCSCLDCPSLYTYYQAAKEQRQISYLEALQQQFLNGS